MNKALIIFVRKPEEGKVKTRLAAEVGTIKALKVYKLLLTHTRELSSQVDASCYVFYAEEIVPDDEWLPPFIKKSQQGESLGEKMQHAFNLVFSEGHSDAVIIGSDCFQLTSAMVEDAFKVLRATDVVIGPAKDGGYYLLGMIAVYPKLFKNKSWSGNNVYDETVKNFNDLRLSHKSLPILNDVDQADDLPPGFLESI